MSGWAGFVVATAIAVGASVGATAAPLKVVDVEASKINCVYHPNCVVIATDTGADIPIPGFMQGGFVQVRTFVGNPGRPAAGKYAYQYRVSMREAAARTAPCVTALQLDFGPVLKLPYAPGQPPADVYVVSSGGPGTIGVALADQVGSQIAFTFAKPICVGQTYDRSDSSFSFGLTANGTPREATAQVQLTGGLLLTLPVRVPTFQAAPAGQKKKKR